MYKEIFDSLAKDSGLYYKIKSEEEAKWFANVLLTHGYSDDRYEFLGSFGEGRDCLILYNFSEDDKEYLLAKENGTLEEIDKVKYEPAKTVINPTYDDLLPLFTDVDNSIKLSIEQEYDTVERPNHYIGLKGLEMEEVLRNFIPRYEDSYVGHRVASAMEYLVRAPLKNGLEDLKKARYNLDQAINHIGGESNEDNE